MTEQTHPTAEQVAAAVHAYVDSFNTQDKANFLDALAGGVIQIDPVGSAPNVGLIALSEFWDGLYGQVDSIELEIRDLIVCGAEAALTFHLVQHTGGDRVDVDGIDTFVVDSAGKIVSVCGFSDAAHIRSGAAYESAPAD